MSFDFTTVPDLGSHVVAKPKGNARHLYYPIVGEALYVGRQIYVNYGDRGRVLCDPETGGARVSILKSEADDAWLVSHPMFVLPFLEILKRKGLYNLHAASLCHEGNGVLLPGGAGSGKSTLALGLVREGFDFLGDDMVFLNPGPEGLQMLAFPDVIDFTDETAAMFPELRDLPPRSQGSDRPKRQVRAEEVFPIGFTPTCHAQTTHFPKGFNQRSERDPATCQGSSARAAWSECPSNRTRHFSKAPERSRRARQVYGNAQPRNGHRLRERC